MRTALMLTITTALLCGAICRADDAANGGRPDLLPRPVRWLAMPADVRRVSIDRQGRPWFQLDGIGTGSIDQTRREVERAAGLKAPWLTGGRVVLFDSAGRIWLLPHADRGLLLGYDPKTGAWIERRDVLPEHRAGYDENSPMSPAVCFTPPAFEGRNGCLYFTDRLGVHVFADGRWSYRHLYELNLKHGYFYGDIHGFNEPHFAEGPDGRVYVWTTWGTYGWSGTVGFFVHDGKSWTQRIPNEWRQEDEAARPPADSVEKPDANRLSSVFPLTEDRVLLCTQSGPAFILDPSDRIDDALRRKVAADIRLLGDDAYAVREDAHRRLLSLGGKILPLLKGALKTETDAEIIERLGRLCESAAGPPTVNGHCFRVAAVRCMDPKGNALLWADRCVTPEGTELRNGGWRISPAGRVEPLPEETNGWYMSADSTYYSPSGLLFFALYRRGCAVLENGKLVPVTDPTETSFRYVLGEDATGRVWLTDESRVVGVHLGMPDARTALPTRIYEVPRRESVACMDSAGCMWAILHPADRGQAAPRAGIARYSGDPWDHFKLPEGVSPEAELRLFMPLKDGCMLAVSAEGPNPACYFDGKQWTAYTDLRGLVEDRYALLAKQIDNRRWGRDFYDKLRVDADGRVWVFQWDRAAAYDGKRWIDLREPIAKVHRGVNSFDFCLPLDGGKKMLVESDGAVVTWIDADGVHADAEAGRKFGLIDNDYTTRSGLWIDSRGRVWLPRRSRSAAVYDGKDVREIPDSGYPRFEDSAGGVWFINPDGGVLTVLDPDGRRAAVPCRWLHASSAVVEDAPGSVWVGTKLGLTHLAVRRGEAGIQIEQLATYDKDVPVGDCLQMWVDKYRNFWFYGPGPLDRYRLYRVTLP